MSTNYPHETPGNISSGNGLSSDGENKITHLFNDTSWNGFNPRETLVSLFKKQVSLTPNNIGVVFKEEKLTYKDLDMKSDRLASHLTIKGVGNGDLVPVWMERSLDWFIAILGILKTGAAYVPIDPHNPLKRASHIIRDINADIVLTSKALGDQLSGEKYKILLLDDIGDATHHIPYSPQTLINPDTLAYVIYTSGSTGKPKGVMVTHSAIQHLIAWHNDRFRVNGQSKLTQIAGQAFDISVWEMWSALLSGASLYVAEDWERIDVKALWEFFLKDQITHGFVPTVLAPTFVEHSKREKSSFLKYLFTAGEQLKPVHTLDLTYELVDYYGPTECTIFATYNMVKEENGKFVPSIGRPIANTQAYILDDQQKVLPLGSVGELCISGVGLASGYLNDKALTKEKFTDHPFLPGKNLYRTGDLAYWMPDGRIRFMGRQDRQVKIRGFRIELGEIERCLLDISGIANAVVITKRNKSGNQYLIAFIVASTTGSLLGRDRIRNLLREELPEYMVPAHFVELQEIPLTENGKTDRELLTKLITEHPQDIQLNVPPSNDMERSIVKIWCEALELSAVNVSDDFFDIGGDSILVAFVITAIEERLGVKAYVRDIYQHKTIQQLAKVFTDRKKGGETLLLEEDMEPYIELQNDVGLGTDIAISNDFDERKLANPTSILLTGATGFVGIHLLLDLLRNHPDTIIYCLTRAHDEVHAMEKIAYAFSRYNLKPLNKEKTRIIAVPGDFSKKNLGLDGKTFDTLARIIDVIYHSGSSVNFIEPYSHMKSPNVDGLKNIIRLATANRTKCLVLLSTISVYSWGHVFTRKKVMRENDDIAQNLEAVSRDIGYVRSKWVMEAIADLAASQGLPVITYRLGYAMCHSATGACAPYQWWAGLVKTCIENGHYPKLEELREGLITVDYMTQTIVHISKNPKALGEKFNLIATPEKNLTLVDFFQLLNQYYGFGLKPLPYQEWRKLWEDDSGNHLYPLTSLFKDNMYKGLSTVELYQHTYVWDCQNVTDFLKGSGIQEPVFNSSLLDKYLQYLNLVSATSP
ncbi:amino acid adenylation domain-containing protein [Galbibacter sp. EGI 63066]|uniref:non-ribosomal peptide synthetase family protein n=1 Tax=Galbibacter sp. EGI 63066 TaxID=2993559 RepID=UPI0022495793|nr:amino acid adenylation domain-containing protein [Galbibacter sp. EGI 63066]MCX2678914.1 amino acid adenylation domain-containing protein [Galbibacter sp. EGI 63066]